MSPRHILSLWFPRLGAERIMRAERGGIAGPLAVVGEQSNTQVISGLNSAAQSEGLWLGPPLWDGHATCAHLLMRARNTPTEAAFLTLLRPWAKKFSPRVAELEPDGLVIDLTGCAHLSVGKAEMLTAVAALRLEVGTVAQLNRLGLRRVCGTAVLPAQFGWRGRDWQLAEAVGPKRIAPE